MADKGWDNEILFHGIDGASGEYLTPTASLQEISGAITGHVFDAEHYLDLEAKKESEKPGYPIPEYLGDASDLKISGWGMIFPEAAAPGQVDDILKAMGELIQLRKSQTGEKRCLILRGSLGFQWTAGKPESKNRFLARHSVSAGNFDPTKVPFHLLIVADPLSIPFRFQQELDVDYACGRIYFQTLEEFARYAHSVVLAETGQALLPRRAAFFGVHNRSNPVDPGDPRTELSKKYLVDPLAQKVDAIISEKNLAWQTQLIEPGEANRQNLQTLLGGSQTPALLFSASHGVGWSTPDPAQVGLQGSLVCADWPGPASGPAQREHYLAAEDLPAGNAPLGLIAFFFACYSAGVPYRDSFSQAMGKPQTQIAHRPFLAALPMKLLGHPNGGALAVVGHVDRTWSCSFMYANLAEQTQPFEAAFRLLMDGKTLGHALDWMNLRYSSLAISLKGLIDDETASPGTVDPKELAYLWTATNDAAGTVILGDPAVRLAVPKKKSQQPSRPVFSLNQSYAGKLPVVFDLPALSNLPASDRQSVALENQKLGLS